MAKKHISLLVVVVLLFSTLFGSFAFAANNGEWEVAYEITIKANYHVQTHGDRTAEGKGAITFGTSGEAKRLESFGLTLEGAPADMEIRYGVYVQTYGDLPEKGLAIGPALVGTKGEARRVEGVKIALYKKGTDELYPGYQISYQVHMQGYSWGADKDSNWLRGNKNAYKTNGDFAGTKGENRRVEGIFLVIEKSAAPKATDNKQKHDPQKEDGEEPEATKKPEEPIDDEWELLELQPRMFYVYDNFGYVDNELTGSKPALADEQEEILANPPYSDNPYCPPTNQDAAVNNNTWRTPGGNWNENTTTTVVNLLRNCRIHEIWFYDGPVYAPSTYTEDGSAPFEVMGGTFKVYHGKDELVSYPVTNEGKWVKVELDGKGIETDTLTFVKEQDTENFDFRYSWSNASWTSPPGEYVCDINIVEIALYGESLGKIPPEEQEEEWPGLTPAERDPADFGFTMGEFIGTNGFFNDAQGNYDSIGFVREYHNWTWTEQTASESNGNAVKPNPKATFIDPWNGVFDLYYKRLKDTGVEVSICIQGGVDGSIIPEGMTSRPNYQGDTNKYKASSYLAHGQSMFQHAARYGSNKDIHPDLVRVAPGTEKKIGLGYVRYYENWNEPDLDTFRGDGAAFAAMTSADYDGHMGTMGPDVGIKQADPNAKLVMGGLAGYIYKTKDSHEKGSTQNEFFEQMIEWFDNNRTEEQWLEAHDTLDGYVRYPFDVINGHSYTTDGDAYFGISAEEYDVYTMMSKFREIRDTYFPEAEIWLSEFGWDSAQGSPHSATIEYEDPVKGVMNQGINTGLTGQEVQGRWLIREYLMLAAAGLDRVQQFMMPNTVETEVNNSGRYATCGLIEGLQGSTKRKPSWYYVGTMKNYLDTAQFDRIIENGGVTDPWVLKFKETQGEENGVDSIYALWLPTSRGDMNGSNYVDYTLDLPEGTEYAYLIELKDKTLQGERTQLEVSDGKVTVPVGESPVFVLANTEMLYLPVEGGILPMAVRKLTQSNTDPGLLFDQGLTDIGGDTSIDLSRAWEPGGLNRYVLIDLGAEYILNAAYVWDANNLLKSGKVFAVYSGDLGEWVPEYGSEDSETVMHQLEGWNREGYTYLRRYLAWENLLQSGPVQTRYLIVGFEDGPEAEELPGGDFLPIPEMVLRGYLAKGQTPPDPGLRVYESVSGIPEVPEDPGEPIIPEEPGVPETPETPEEPDEPEKPEAPEESGSPDEPEEPGIPEEPRTSEEAERPEMPAVVSERIAPV